jgi:peptide-methionine (S)-S-oxide reductase
MGIAIFSAGCFWGVEAAFYSVPGVLGTTVGYTGGSTKDPTYREVCTGKTGHAESIRIEFDEKETAFSKLLDVFWSIHDPTTKDRQGPDIGTQYRSAIFYTDGSQKDEALKSMEKQQESLGRKIVTALLPAVEFYPAEEYHQKYFLKNGTSCC